MRKLGISSYDVGSVLAISIAQRLVRRVCKECATQRPLNEKEIAEFNAIAKRYDVKFNLDGAMTYDTVGCEHCNKTGYYGRIAANEILEINDTIKDLIVSEGHISEIRAEAYKTGYRPLVVDAFNKILEGHTTLNEVKNKLAY